MNTDHAIDSTPSSAPALEPTPAPAPEPAPKKKRFDVSELRINPSKMESTAVETQMLSVSVRKPKKQEFIRVHPDESYRLLTPVIRLQEEDQSDDYYIVHPDVALHLADEISYCCFYTSVTRQGWPFLWPVMWPSPDGKPNKWLTSGHEAAEKCIHKWSRVIGVQELQSYVLKTAPIRCGRKR